MSPTWSRIVAEGISRVGGDVARKLYPHIPGIDLGDWLEEKDLHLISRLPVEQARARARRARSLAEQKHWLKDGRREVLEGLAENTHLHPDIYIPLLQAQTSRDSWGKLVRRRANLAGVRIAVATVAYAIALAENKDPRDEPWAPKLTEEEWEKLLGPQNWRIHWITANVRQAIEECGPACAALRRDAKKSPALTFTLCSDHRFVTDHADWVIDEVLKVGKQHPKEAPGADGPERRGWETIDAVGDYVYGPPVGPEAGCVPGCACAQMRSRLEAGLRSLMDETLEIILDAKPNTEDLGWQEEARLMLQRRWMQELLSCGDWDHILAQHTAEEIGNNGVVAGWLARRIGNNLDAWQTIAGITSDGWEGTLGQLAATLEL